MRSTRNKLIGSIHNAYDLAYEIRKEDNKGANIDLIIRDRVIIPINSEINLTEESQKHIRSSYSFLVSSVAKPNKLFIQKIPETRKWGLSRKNEGNEDYLSYLNEQVSELTDEINRAGLKPRYYFHLSGLIYSQLIGN